MQAAIRLKARDTIVFIGDSITDAEHHRQAYTPLGFGYAHFAGNLLRAWRPELNLNLVNTGVSGDTIIDLECRWERDCIAHHPDVVSVLVGINDVWQLTMEPDLAVTAADAGRYEVTYDQLLSRAADQCGCQFVLMEPFMFCRGGHNPVFNALGPYIEIVQKLAAKYDAVLVPLQRRIARRIEEVPPEMWSDDGVHPHVWAHAWIAMQWLQATGLWPKIDA